MKKSSKEIIDKANSFSVNPYWDADNVEDVVRLVAAWAQDISRNQLIRDTVWSKIKAQRNSEAAKETANEAIFQAKYATSNINQLLDFSKTQLITPSAKYVEGAQLGDMVPPDRFYENAYDAYLVDYYGTNDISYCDANAPNGFNIPESEYKFCNLASDQYATTELKLQDFDLPLIKFNKALKDVMFYLYKQKIGLTEEVLNSTTGLNGDVPIAADTIYYRPIKEGKKLNDAQWKTLNEWFKGMIRFKVMSPRVFVEQLYFPRLINQLMQKNGWDYNTAHDQALKEIDTELPGIKKKILQEELQKLTELAGEIKDSDAGWTDYCATISGYATLSTDLQKLFAEQNPDAVAKCKTFKKSTDPTDSGLSDPTKDPNQPDAKTSSTKNILIAVGVVVGLAIVGWAVWKFTRKKGA